MMTKEFQLDRRSAMPLHEQIEGALRLMIQRPEYKAGEVLPDEVTLAEKFAVSRNTLRAALGRLVNDGLLERVRKRGTVVKSQKVMTSLKAWHSFTEEMRHRGIEVENYDTTVSQQEPAADVAAVFQSKPGQRLWCLRRVRGWDNKPVLIAISWFSPSIPLKGTEDFSQPLYRVIGGYPGAKPHLSREQISAEPADAETAEALQLKVGAPVLVRRRTILNRTGEPIEYNLNIYAGSRYSLDMELR